MRLSGFLAIGFMTWSLSAMAQQPLRPPQIAPFGDSQWWVMTEAIPTRIGRSEEIITVPKGFVTDLASIPRFFWATFPKTGQYMSAAILHDYLYWDQRCTREQADRIFDIEMKSYGVNDTARTLIFSAVSELGASAWQANGAAKAGGELRFLPEPQLAHFLSQPFDATRTWPVIRSQIPRDPTRSGNSGATDPNSQLATVCARAIAANAGQ
ncbi:MAG TPA: DUF1353 domain-containing protein [Thermoanaerobaculia bacterium]|nr:DUF1353 domain-containing protein [Thermoanaerobaculia bacterium]